MSKLSEAIRRTVKRESAPMGFQRLAARDQPATMLVVATVRESTGSAVGAAASAGADVVLIAPDNPPAPDALKEMAGSAGSATLGIWLRQASTEAAKAAGEAGIDFLVFADDNTPAQVLLDEKLGFVLSLAESADDTTLRVIESLPLDAVLVSYWDGELTVKRALELRRLAVLTRRPLILSVSADISAGDLEALRESGVAAVIVDAARAGEGAVREVKARIAALPPRRKQRNEERAQVSLPAPGGAGGHDHGDDDDDD